MHLQLLVMQFSVAALLALVGQGGAHWLELAEHARSALVVDAAGARLKAFDLGGVQFGEPSISYKPVCPTVSYDYFYLKYKLELPIVIDADTLKQLLGSSTYATLGKVTVSELRLQTSDFPIGAGVSLRLHLLDSGVAHLLLLTDTYERYRHLKIALLGNPQSLQHSVKFLASGILDSNTHIRFGAIQSSNVPSLSCPTGNWVVFQRRVDGSLSFVQNWDTYVKGFGNPSANYWMGLDQLFFSTARSGPTVRDANQTNEAGCRLKIEADDFNGTRYTGEWDNFQVLDSNHSYELRFGRLLNPDSKLSLFAYQNGSKFSTFDHAESDAKSSGSCSREYGYSGWWFRNCHYVLLNGAYPADANDKNPAKMSVFTTAKHWIPMRRTVMMYKC